MDQIYMNFRCDGRQAILRFASRRQLPGAPSGQTHEGHLRAAAGISSTSCTAAGLYQSGPAGEAGELAASASRIAATTSSTPFGSHLSLSVLCCGGNIIPSPSTYLTRPRYIISKETSCGRPSLAFIESRRGPGALLQPGRRHTAVPRWSGVDHLTFWRRVLKKIGASKRRPRYGHRMGSGAQASTAVKISLPRHLPAGRRQGAHRRRREAR